MASCATLLRFIVRMVERTGGPISVYQMSTKCYPTLEQLRELGFLNYRNLTPTECQRLVEARNCAYKNSRPVPGVLVEVTPKGLEEYFEYVRRTLPSVIASKAQQVVEVLK